MKCRPSPPILRWKFESPQFSKSRGTVACLAELQQCFAAGEAMLSARWVVPRRVFGDRRSGLEPVLHILCTSPRNIAQRRGVSQILDRLREQVRRKGVNCCTFGLLSERIVWETHSFQVSIFLHIHNINQSFCEQLQAKHCFILK